MKKDFLLPIAAIALAPVGAYAAISTADVSKDATIAAKDGTLEYSLIPGTYTVNVQKAGVSISAAEGVLTSGAGDVTPGADAPATQTIVVAKSGVVTVKAAADGAVVSITVVVTKTGDLESNYKTLADDLSKELALVGQDIDNINTSTTGATAEKQKAVDAYTEVTGKIKTLSETTDTDYAKWVTASTTTKNEISSAITSLKTTVANATTAANADAKKALTTASTYVNGKITTLKNTIANDSKYTQADATVASALKVLTDLKTALDNEAKKDSPNANQAFSSTVTEAPADASVFNAAVDSQVRVVNSAITNAEAVNTNAYSRSTANVKAAKTTYDNALAALKAALVPTEDYANLYAAAAQELTTQYDAIASVEAKVKANVKNAVDTESGYASDLEAIKTEIAAIQSKYEAQHTALAQAYSSTVTNTVTPLQTELNGYVARLGDAAKDEKDSHRYDVSIAEIQGDIDALSSYITGELQAVNTSDGKASYTENNAELTKKKNAISVKLTTLKKATVKYESYVSALATIAGVQSEKDALVEHLNANKSEKDADYVSIKYFEDRANLVQYKINALKSAANTQYNGTSTTVTVSTLYKNVNISNTTVGNDITSVQNDADAALTKYNSLYDKKVEFDAAVTAAEAVLAEANTSVIYGYATNPSNTKTYAAKLAELKAQRDEFAGNLSTAKGKTTGTEHKGYLDGLNLSKNASLLTAITADGYKADETDFNNAALYNSTIVSIEEAKAKIANEQATIDAYTKAGRGTYGNAWATSTGTAGDLQTEVANLQAKLDVVSQGLNEQFYDNGNLKKDEIAANPAASLSSVNKIQEQLAALAEDFAKLEANAKTVADTYANVLAVQKELTNNLKAVKNSLSNITLDYSSITSKKTFESQDKSNFTSKKTAIGNEITSLQSEIDAAANAETIVADRTTTVADGTTTTGLDDKIAAIKTEVSDFSTLVGEWNTNDANKQALLDLAKDKNVASTSGTAFTSATAAVTNAYRNVTTEGASISKDYYNAQIQSLKEQLGAAETASTILGNIAADYADHKLKDATVKDEYTQEINNLVAALDAIKANVSTNLQNYRELVGEHDALQSAWDKAFEAYNATDESALKEDYKNKLSALRTDILDIKNELQEASKGNLYNGSNTADYTKIKNEIASKKVEVDAVTAYYTVSNGESGYITELKAENQAELDKLTEARDAARKTFRDDLDNLNTYLNDMPSVYNEKLIAGHDAMYALYDEITEAYNTAKAEKEAADKAVKPYDATDAIATIQGLQTQIDAALATAKSDANNAYIAIVDATLADADAAKSAVQTEIEATTPFKAVDATAGIAAAFDKEYNALSAAKTDANVAIVYDNTYSSLLKDLDGLKNAAREAAAQNHWDTEYEVVQSNYFKLSSGVSTLKIKGNSDFDALKAEFNSISLPDLNSAVEETGWLNVYGDYANNAGDALKSISATIDRLQSEYNGLKTDFDASKKNLTELNKLVTEANKTANNYADWYEKYELVQYYVLDAISEYTQTVKDLKSEYTTVANQGLLINAQERGITTYTDYTNEVNAAITKLNGLNTASTEKEYAALGDAINLLKSDFNGLTDDQKASIDYQTVQARINRIQTEYDALTNTDNPDYTYAKTATYNPEKKNYDIYRDLESRVASERAAMPGNAEKISTQKATLLADVNSLLTNVNAEIKNLQYAGYDLLTEDNKATVDDEVAAYKEQLSELKTQVTDFKTSINNISGGSLLVLIENKTITNNRTALEDDYAALAGEIATSKKPYETNYNSYKAALDKLEASGKVLDEAVTTVGDFANEALTRSSNTYTIALTKYAIEAKKEELKDNVSLLSYTEEPDELKVGDFTVDGVAALFVKRYEQKQLLDRLDALKDADGLYTQVEALIDPTSTYLTVTTDELNDDLYAVGQLIQASQYNIKGDYEDAIGDTRYDSYNGTDFYEFVYSAPNILFSKVKTDAAEDYDDIVEALEALKEKINENKYVLGDINKDGRVTVSDYDALRDIVILKEEIAVELDALRYDVNADDEINVADVQNVVAIITGKFQGVNAARRVAFAPAAASTSSDAASIQAVGEGISRKLSVLLNNSVAYTGAQFDVTLPEGVTLEGVNLTARSAGLDVVFNEIASGIYRVLITSLDNITFQGNEGSIVDLDVEVSPNYDGSGVSLDNVVTTDAAARAYHLDTQSEATGIATVSATTYVKEKIYSVGGQLLDGLKKGVNIIRGNDGSTKKIIRK